MSAETLIWVVWAAAVVLVMVVVPATVAAWVM